MMRKKSIPKCLTTHIVHLLGDPDMFKEIKKNKHSNAEALFGDSERATFSIISA